MKSDQSQDWSLFLTDALPGGFDFTLQRERAGETHSRGCSQPSTGNLLEEIDRQALDTIRDTAA